MQRFHIGLLIIALVSYIGLAEGKSCGGEENSEKIFSVKELTKVPYPKLIPGPVATVDEINGEVEVEFVVTKEGKAKGVKILSSTDEKLSDIVLGSIDGWRFTPGEIDGSPVNSRVRITIPFKFE